MSITVVAEDVRDAIRKLGGYSPKPSISINFMLGSDYGKDPVKGAIVTDNAHGKIPLEFESSLKALSYVKKLLMEHDKYVVAEIRCRKSEAKKMKKK